MFTALQIKTENFKDYFKITITNSLYVIINNILWKNIFAKQNYSEKSVTALHFRINN